MQSKKAIPAAILEFQQRLFRDYKKCLSLPEPYQYLHGTPIHPVVPLDIAQNSLFILGAYPSARFATIQRERDVPVGDNCGPFSTERYFDGQTIRTVDSGYELEQGYLRPLGFQREQCWITDIVRVFLFKDKHLAKYRRLGCPCPERETRSQFELFAEQGIHWLQEELQLAQPRIVITLGSEVAGILQHVKSQQLRNELLGGGIQEFKIGNTQYPVIHLAHPGIVMRPGSDRNPWPELHKIHIAEARTAVAQI